MAKSVEHSRLYPSTFHLLFVLLTILALPLWRRYTLCCYPQRVAIKFAEAELCLSYVLHGIVRVRESNASGGLLSTHFLISGMLKTLSLKAFKFLYLEKTSGNNISVYSARPAKYKSAHVNWKKVSCSDLFLRLEKSALWKLYIDHSGEHYVNKSLITCPLTKVPPLAANCSSSCDK